MIYILFEIIRAAEEKDCTFLNPGSISRPRQDGGRHTYIVLDITENKNFIYNLCSIEK